ncbi:MAG: hypothetical protein Kow0080_36420 [Candidatus Promineifilaceae bacterium]
MDERLAQAIAAARHGQKKEAQFLLTQLLKDNPEETQGWFLLSHLVDDPTQKQAFLQKVLALDPAHEKAQSTLKKLTTVGSSMPAFSVSEDDDYMAQAAGNTLPNWLANDADNLRLDEVEATLAQTSTQQDVDEDDEEIELPNWLSNFEDDDDLFTDSPGPKTAVNMQTPKEKKPEKVLTTAPNQSPKIKAKKQEKGLTLILYALIAVSVLVFIALVYLVITTL